MQLGNYEDSPPADFWATFPSFDIPSDISQNINVEKLEELISSQEQFLTCFEIARAQTCCNNLRNGADSFQKSYLPPCSVGNAKNSMKYAEQITDTIATWIKKEFVAGPFDTPPLKDFRVNSILAVDQGEKIRPVLNVSLPEGESFNSNINELLLEKVYMSNARRFGFSVCEAGVNAKMSKFDLVDAYKNVPVRIFDLRLQGFAWLSKFFFECRQIFGAKTAVQNFDILGNTILTLAAVDTHIAKKFIHRALDDSPFVAPAKTFWCEELSENYTVICKAVGIELAKNCEKFEKAFVNSTYGKVLGIFFDTTTLSWKLPEDKKMKAISCIKKIFESHFVTLLQMQELMGRLNDICQMCSFMRGFVHPLYSNIAKMAQNPTAIFTIDSQGLKDLNIWVNFLTCKVEWLPIPHCYYDPPLACVSFSSDAAGGTNQLNSNDALGCGSVGFSHIGTVFFACQLFWPEKVLQFASDCKGSQLGNKTTTLEFLGILLPFLLIPEHLANIHVTVKVDNIGCFFGWVNRHVTGDVMASILIRALHLISAYLGCQVHICHLPRKSSWDANLVDRLSRARSTTENDKKLLRSFPKPSLPICLAEWMKNPSEDWDLAWKLLDHVKCATHNLLIK